MRSRVTPYFLMPISDLCLNEATTEATILSGFCTLSGFTSDAGFVFIYLHWFLGLRLALQVLCTEAISKDILLTSPATTRLTTFQRCTADIVNHVANPNLSSHKFFGGFFKEFVSKHLTSHATPASSILFIIARGRIIIPLPLISGRRPLHKTHHLAAFSALSLVLVFIVFTNGF